jgi:tRNA nucleotidyltransferase (CCA-adding enzyme)
MKDAELHPPAYVLWAARTLEEAGYETWAVGGAIRNTLLGLPSGDWDLTTRAPPTAVRRLFKRTVPVGLEHGTVGVLTREGTLLEVTTFRRDIETFGRKAVVEFAGTLEEDLARRDFTVNAIAWHPLSRRLRDPFDGMNDLEAGILRTVGVARERFSEDYLRVLRALRFSGRFNFVIHGDTWDALTASTKSLGVLSPERIREELLKVLAGDPRPSGALSLYQISGVLRALFPEVEASTASRREAADDSLWVHSLLVADALPKERPLLRLAVLFQGVGHPDGRPGPGPEGSGSEGEGIEWTGGRRERVAALMIRLRFSNAEIRTITELIQAGMEPPVHLEGGASLRRWLHRAGPEQLPSLVRIWAASARMDRLRKGKAVSAVVDLVGRLRGEIRSGAALRDGDLAIDGRDLISLGLRPGPRFGEILQSLMEEVLEDPGLNQKDLLRDRVLSQWASGEGGAK